MLTVYLIVTALFLGIPFLWLMLKFAPWSAPLPAAGSFLVFVIGVYAESGRLMAFGFLAFCICALIFVVGGGLAGR